MNEQVDQQRWIRMDQEAYEVPEAVFFFRFQEVTKISAEKFSAPSAPIFSHKNTLDIVFIEGFSAF